MRRVVLLTSVELRHEAFRRTVAARPELDVVLTVREDLSGALEAGQADGALDERQRAHLDERGRSERDFFELAAAALPDAGEALDIERGRLNDDEVVDRIVAARPDVVASYGCSIVRHRLLDAFVGRFVNVHLGLSPYYRGSGTNFWPLVDGRPELVGATFMHIDAGIDTGAIIDQLRARVHPGDSAHQIGNRLIADMILRYSEILARFDELQPLPPLPEPPGGGRYLRYADFTGAAVDALHRQMRGGLVERYLAEREERIAGAPIRENPALSPPPA